jgi:hypothetical protein
MREPTAGSCQLPVDANCAKVHSHMNVQRADSTNQEIYERPLYFPGSSLPARFVLTFADEYSLWWVEHVWPVQEARLLGRRKYGGRTSSHAALMNLLNCASTGAFG